MTSTLQRLFNLGAAAFVAVALLGGCSAMVAQNPSSPLKPVNAVRSGDDARLMLNGADVVAYFTMGKFVQGTPQHRSSFEEVTFHFANAEHKAKFDATPQKFLPQFGGFCANGIAYAIPWGGDADRFAIIDGKLYIFGGQGSKDAFDLDVAGNLKLAEKYWADEVAGNNSFWQRSKRLVIRVPHYKSGEELAKMVAEAKARKGG
jgi:YHS domain-containing protein